MTGWSMIRRISMKTASAGIGRTLPMPRIKQEMMTVSFCASKVFTWILRSVSTEQSLENGNMAIPPLTGTLRTVCGREKMKWPFASYFSHPTADGTAVPESIVMYGWYVCRRHISRWTASTPLLWRRKKAMTWPSIRSWNGERTTEIMHWNIVCIIQGTVKAPQKQQAGRFSG